MQVLAPAQQVAASKAMMSAQKLMDKTCKKRGQAEILGAEVQACKVHRGFSRAHSDHWATSITTRCPASIKALVISEPRPWVPPVMMTVLLWDGVVAMGAPGGLVGRKL